jgi:hypothetical protein
MKSKAGAGPARPGVQRHFESNRLAKQWQAQAYEQVLPLGAASNPEREPIEIGPDNSKVIKQGGLAA